MNEIETTIQRGDCFKLLAACFYEPEKHLFIEEELGEKLEQLLRQLSPNCVTAARRMKSALLELDQSTLSIDHAALFVGPFELTAAPYGSVYVDKRRTVMGESTIKTAQFYQDAGLSVDIKEPPDHIAIVLEFMYYLCSKEADALSKKQFKDALKIREKQREFYFSALMPWGRKFCQAIRVGTDNVFYINVADCLEHFLASCEQFYYESSTAKAV